MNLEIFSSKVKFYKIAGKSRKLRYYIFNSDRVIDSNMTKWSPEDDCFKINENAAPKFMGHSTREFIMQTPFSKFQPSWMKVKLHEEVGPK